MSMEDNLSNMFRNLGIGKGASIPALLNTLIRNTQINMLKQLRRQLDDAIKVLTEEAAEKVAYDENLDPYKILDVEMTATREEIDKAYKAKARTAHPDRGGTDQEMIMVNAAYEAIRQFRGWK